MKEWLKSRKAKAFMTALIVIVAVHLFGMDEESAVKIAEQVMTLTIGYMGAQGIADHGQAKKERPIHDPQV